MKSPIEIVNDVWQHLNSGSSLKSAISGIVCKKRPAGSTKEDVSINCLTVDNEQLQSGIVNVNIYAPNKVQQIGGVQDNSQPDYGRLETLSNLAKTDLDEVWLGDYWFRIQQMLGPIEDENNQHYINVRLEYFNENL